jgi:hypothetical protein
MTKIENYLTEALAVLKKAQDELLLPCELYIQLEDMQLSLQSIIEDKGWEGRV